MENIFSGPRGHQFYMSNNGVNLAANQTQWWDLIKHEQTLFRLYKLIIFTNTGSVLPSTIALKASGEAGSQIPLDSLVLPSNTAASARFFPNTSVTTAKTKVYYFPEGILIDPGMQLIVSHTAALTDINFNAFGFYI